MTSYRFSDYNDYNRRYSTDNFNGPNPGDGAKGKTAGDARIANLAEQLSLTPTIDPRTATTESILERLERENESYNKQIDAFVQYAKKNHPSACERLALLIKEMSSTHNPAQRYRAFVELINLLKNTSINADTAVGSIKLIKIMVTLLKSTEEETIDFIQLMIRTFSYTMENAIRFYKDKHNISVSQDLKKELLGLAKILEKLNSKQLDPIIKEMLRISYEASKRITDDTGKLEGLFQRMVALFDGLGSAWRLRPSEFIAGLEGAFGHLGANSKQNWFEVYILLQDYVKDAPKDFESCHRFLELFGKSIDHKKVEKNYKFAYAQVRMLAEIASQTKDPNILTLVLTGGHERLGNKKLPCLFGFFDTNIFQLGKAKGGLNRDKEFHIYCAKILKQLEANIPESAENRKTLIAIRVKLKVLSEQAGKEKNQEMIDALAGVVPKTVEDITVWGDFAQWYDPTAKKHDPSKFLPLQKPAAKPADDNSPSLAQKSSDSDQSPISSGDSDGNPSPSGTPPKNAGSVLSSSPSSIDFAMDSRNKRSPSSQVKRATGGPIVAKPLASMKPNLTVVSDKVSTVSTSTYAVSTPLRSPSPMRSPSSFTRDLSFDSRTGLSLNQPPTPTHNRRDSFGNSSLSLSSPKNASAHSRQSSSDFSNLSTIHSRQSSSDFSQFSNATSNRPATPSRQSSDKYRSPITTSPLSSPTRSPSPYLGGSSANSNATPVRASTPTHARRPSSNLSPSSNTATPRPATPKSSRPALDNYNSPFDSNRPSTAYSAMDRSVGSASSNSLSSKIDASAKNVDTHFVQRLYNKTLKTFISVSLPNQLNVPTNYSELTDFETAIFSIFAKQGITSFGKINKIDSNGVTIDGKTTRHASILDWHQFATTYKKK